MCATVCLDVGCAIKNGSHQEPFYPHERYAIIERMKTGDKAFLRLDGVVYVGTVKRAFLSPFGVPSVAERSLRSRYGRWSAPMLDQPAQFPTREETLAAIAKSLAFYHLVSRQMREATRASHHTILESKELLVLTDRILSRI